MIADVPAVNIYPRLRRGVPADALRLSVGRNLFAPVPALEQHLGALLSGLVAAHRFGDYESADDRRDRELVAWLLDRHLGAPGIGADDVFFTLGAQEAIGLVAAYGAHRGAAALLPLPLYYAFEQSARRWGLEVAGYYRGDGRILWLDEDRRAGGRPLLRALIVPNGMTGTLFAAPADAGDGFTLADFVFQLGGGERPGALAEHTRQLVAGLDLGRSALVFTASKDLALPGVRAGVLVSRDRELLAFARADRFERLYSIGPVAGRVVATYLALVVVAAAEAADDDEEDDEVRRAFTAAELPFPDPADLARVLAGFDAQRARCTANLERLERPGGPLALPPALRPAHGYSALPRLDLPFADADELVAWTRYTGIVHRLKVNPDLLYGADWETWEALYPDGRHLRVNLSEDPGRLDAALARLEAAADGWRGGPANRGGGGRLRRPASGRRAAR